MERLKESLKQFLTTQHKVDEELFERLALKQEPSVLFITCADSRISLITHTKPGEMFVVRNVANVVPPYSLGLAGEAAAVEYGVSVLRVEDIIVCGHTRCGGVKAVFEKEQSSELPAVRSWLEHLEITRRIVLENFADLSPAERWEKAVEVNVMAQLSNLRTHPAVASAMHGGRLTLHGWIYDIARGSVSAFDPIEERFLPITMDDNASAL
jgi:carbonic anhydrase